MKNFPLSAESAPEEFREKDKVGGPVRSCPPPPSVHLCRPPSPRGSVRRAGAGLGTGKSGSNGGKSNGGAAERGWGENRALHSLSGDFSRLSRNFGPPRNSAAGSGGAAAAGSGTG